jgi:hypothetical protein
MCPHLADLVRRQPIDEFVHILVVMCCGHGTIVRSP